MKQIFPLEVKRGNATVKIYRREKNGYEEYRLSYYDADGSRKLQSFSCLQTAKDEAAAKATSLSTGDVTALSLSGDDRLSYVRAMEALKPIKVRVEMAATEYARYWQQMGGDFFKEAVTEFIARRNNVKPVTVRELVALFIEQKTATTKRSRPAWAGLALSGRAARSAGEGGVGQGPATPGTARRATTVRPQHRASHVSQAGPK